MRLFEIKYLPYCFFVHVFYVDEDVCNFQNFNLCFSPIFTFMFCIWWIGLIFVIIIIVKSCFPLVTDDHERWWYWQVSKSGQESWFLMDYYWCNFSDFCRCRPMKQLGDIFILFFSSTHVWEKVSFIHFKLSKWVRFVKLVHPISSQQIGRLG